MYGCSYIHVYPGTTSAHADTGTYPGITDIPRQSRAYRGRAGHVTIYHHKSVHTRAYRAYWAYWVMSDLVRHPVTCPCGSVAGRRRADITGHTGTLPGHGSERQPKPSGPP